MKYRFVCTLLLSLLTAALFLSFVTIVHGQQEPRTPTVPEDKSAATTTDAPVAEPGEWDTKIHQLDGGKLVALEAQVAIRRVTVSLKGETSAYIYQGPASSKRIASSAPVFIMRLEKDANPTSLIALYPAEKKKKERQVGQTQITQKLELTFVRYGNTSVKITVSQELTPGEYAFRTASGTSYLFGVDPKVKP